MNYTWTMGLFGVIVSVEHVDLWINHSTVLTYCNLIEIHYV